MNNQFSERSTAAENRRGDKRYGLANSMSSLRVNRHSVKQNDTKANVGKGSVENRS
jgi:hypothetical protein